MEDMKAFEKRSDKTLKPHCVIRDEIILDKREEKFVSMFVRKTRLANR